MTWFRVDDKFHSHRKRLRAGVPAIGLWTIAGSWCSDHLTDGFIPDYVALSVDLDAEAHAASLVTAGLWSEGEREGERGWYFRGWDEHQPSRESVENTRNAARDRKRRERERGAASRAADGTFAGQNGVTPMSRRDSSVTHEAVTPESREVSRTPSPVARPVPSRPGLPSEVDTSSPPTSSAATTKAKPRTKKAASRIPEDFSASEAMIAWAKKETPDVGAAETKQFVDHWVGKGETRADWVATWRTWMRNAQSGRYGRSAGPAKPDASSGPSGSQYPENPYRADPDFGTGPGAPQWLLDQQAERRAKRAADEPTPEGGTS